jgi:sugar fermentation stimulation protein A
MILPPLIPAEFVWRNSRFTAAVRVEGKPDQAHIANTGRLPGLLNPGVRVWLAAAGNPKRKTRYDLKLVEHEGVLVSLDTRLPNYLFEEAARAGQLPEFNYPEIKLEVKLGQSRIDAFLSGPEGVCWVETKSVTLVENKIGMFPDAPTSRGRKHLLELGQSLANGVRAAVVFVIQRPDAEIFSPHTTIDPEFSKVLAAVARKGVLVRAYRCEVSVAEIRIDNEIECQF